MSHAGLALHCRSTSPELTIHVKIYLPAQAGGTEDYMRQGSAKRIARLHDRFQELINEDGVATVPIHKLHHSDRGLMVFMECVAIIKNLFDDDPDAVRADTPRALRELDTGKLWLHFDICPRNVGRTSDGAFCYLDLESLYKVGEQHVPVSESLTKWYRIPGSMIDKLSAELQSEDGLSPELAETFQNYQLGRLAMDMFAGCELEGSDVEGLTKEKLDHADMWDEQFVQPVILGQAPDPKTLADAIDECVGLGAAGQHSPGDD